MLRATLLAIVFALCGTGLFAQDDLAQYQEHMKAADAANRALRGAGRSGDAAGVTTNANNMVTQFDWIANLLSGQRQRRRREVRESVQRRG